MGIEKGAGINGSNAATIKSIDEEINGFGTLMQNCQAGSYAGKRVRLSASVKTKDSEGATLWLRADLLDSTQHTDSVAVSVVAFANTYEQLVTGTTDWKRYAIVLDIPSNASRLSFGGALNGTGQMWFDDVVLEIVTTSVSTTAPVIPAASIQKSMMDRKRVWVTLTHPQPTNLSFEE